MRNLVLYELVSVDGVAEEPGDWLFEAGDEVFSNLGRIIERQDDIILGRKTYEYWVDYWPTSDVEPFATFINSTTKHVATSNELDKRWANTVEIAQPLPDYVQELKQQDAGDIGVHGSIDISRTLLAAGLVDVVHLVVAPTLAGSGKTLWARMSGLQRLTLEQADTDPYGNLFLTYRSL